MPNGDTVEYTVPVVPQVQEFTCDDMLQEAFAVLLPYHVIKYEQEKIWIQTARNGRNFWMSVRKSKAIWRRTFLRKETKNHIGI